MKAEELIQLLNERSRRTQVIVYRQCLIYLLHRYFKLSCYHIHTLLGYDTSTVRNALLRFVDCLSVGDHLSQLTLNEMQQHRIACDLEHVYIDGQRLNA